MRHLLLAVVLLIGCGGLPKAPAYPKKGDSFSPPQALARPGMPADRALPLTLAPGDVLTIELTAQPPSTLTNVVIDGAGRVHLPMAGDVEVAGRGLSDAEGKIQAALRKFDRFVEVTIQVTTPGGQRVTVLGAVATQGAVQLLPGARVTDVIAASGGPTVTSEPASAPIPLADMDGAVVTRNGRPLPISIAKALAGDPAHNVYMHPGDHVYVPPALGANVSVFGQVGGARAFPFRAGLRLSEALAMAGGVTAGADKGDIRVIRGTLSKPRVYRASLSALVDGRTHDVALQAGDIIFVTDHAIEDIGEVMAIVSSALSLGLSSAALAISANSAR